MDITLIAKLVNITLVTGLSSTEFACKCTYDDCTHTLYNHRTINAYGIVRKQWNEPLIVTSGFRCQRHNSDVGGVHDSWHKKGSAIDIKPVKDTKKSLVELYDLASSFFDYVKLYEDDGFIHCQMEE